MATVYKIEIEVTSRRVAYTSEQVKEAIEKGMKEVSRTEKVNKPSNELTVDNLKVIIIA